MLGGRRKTAVPFALLALAVTGWFVGGQIYVSGTGYGLPYYAQFEDTVEDEWTAWGGVWEIANGSMRNDSNDPGAKIVTGSPNWRNYVVEGDVQLLGRGSVGILGRVSEAELGENAFKGYLAGVRTADHSLFLGAYDFVYREAARVQIPEAVRPHRWYHIRLEVNDCLITASAWVVGTSDIYSGSAEDPDCLTSGAIGLRSNGTGAVWRNVRVLPLDAATPGVPGLTEDLPLLDASAFSPARLSEGERAETPVQTVRSLTNMSPFGSPQVKIRGFVVLTRPTIYVQDSTGGVAVQFHAPTPLKIGDEVEILGEVNQEGFSPAIQNSKFRVLRETTPEGPLPMTAHQLVSGQYDGQFIQVEGILRETSMEPDGSVSLALDAGSQSFRVAVPPGRGPYHVTTVQPGSQLRLKGVSAVDSPYRKPFDPFVVHIRSAEDIEVVSGPPLWRPRTLILAGLLALCLLFVLNHIYLMIKNWRLRAIAEERERLAHQIHDTLAQSFAGIGYQLQAIRNTIPEGNEDFEQRVDLAISMARNSHEEARRCIANLRPESLEQVVLLPALREYAELMVKNGAVKIEMLPGSDGRGLPPRVRDALFRIGREAIANAVRHANPGTIRILFEGRRSHYFLSVEDDGIGFRSEADSAGFGLVGMRKRAKTIAASLAIWSKPGEGTRVEVMVPMRLGFLRQRFFMGANWRRKIWSAMKTSES